MEGTAWKQTDYNSGYFANKARSHQRKAESGHRLGLGQDDLWGGRGLAQGPGRMPLRLASWDPSVRGQKDRDIFLPPSPSGGGGTGGILGLYFPAPPATSFCQLLSLGPLRPHLEPRLGMPLSPGPLGKESFGRFGSIRIAEWPSPALSALATLSGSPWEAEDGGGRVRFSIHRGQRSACQPQVTRTILKPQNSAIPPGLSP